MPIALVPSAGRNTQSYHVVSSQHGTSCIPNRPMNDFCHSSPEKSVTLRCQGRPNFVAATTTVTSLETNGRGLLCLGQLYDPTLIANIASHTRASTTLKTDVGVVSSVTVNPRATHPTEKRTAKKGHNHSSRENHASFWRTQVSTQ